VGLGVTDAARMRLEVAHVSGIYKWTKLVLIDDESKTWRNWKVMWLLWLRTGMCVEDINPNEDDGKLSVSIIPQMMRTLEMPRDARSSHLMPPAMPPRQMAIYMVQPNQDGSADQAQMPIFLPVHMPRTLGSIVIKVNLGMDDQPRDEDMTADKDGKNKHSRSNMTGAPLMSSPKLSRGNMRKARTGCTQVPKKAEVIASTEPREVPCNRCQTQGQECLLKIKGGKALDMYVGDWTETLMSGRWCGWEEKCFQGARGKWYGQWGECWELEVVDEGI